MLEKQQAAAGMTYESPESLQEKSSQFYKNAGFWNPTVEAMLSYNVARNDLGAIVHAWRKHASDAYMSIYFTLRFVGVLRAYRVPNHDAP